MRAGSPRVGGWWGRGWLPLLLVLVVQAGLSARLLGADTAFQDEAAYLWAGHLEWAHWLHGAVIPPFASYFSGAPVMYPPLGALADSVGGLTGARLLSLVFMLGATVAAVGCDGPAVRPAAPRSSPRALFAVSGPTLHLGAFATYDAMSLFLLALWRPGWWPAPRNSRRRRAGWPRPAWYSRWPTPRRIPQPCSIRSSWPWPSSSRYPSGRRLAARRCGCPGHGAVSLIIAGVLLGGNSYWQGITQTTLGRAAGAASPLRVLQDALSWTGVIIVLAICGVVASWVSHRYAARTWLLVVLTAAALLGPLEQAHLHTLDALNKHVGLGAWFAAIAAGYAVDRFITAAPAGQPRR